MTISGADRLMDEPREELAERSGRRSLQRPGLPARAAALADRQGKARDLRRDAPAGGAPPRRGDAWRNLLLAGDWTATGLPATIEGAIRSGDKAAELAGGSGPV